MNEMQKSAVKVRRSIDLHRAELAKGLGGSRMGVRANSGSPSDVPGF
jgi:hypothetical protein